MPYPNIPIFLFFHSYTIQVRVNSDIENILEKKVAYKMDFLEEDI
jgi:surface polysaccharide O-acyltransferase-like enzyme